MNIKYLLSFLSTVGIVSLSTFTRAQTYQPSNRRPVADNSLGTQVSGTNNKDFTITGGLNRGQNVFHSFQDFSVPTDGSATFNNPVGNQSIITRVTGSNFSDINGLVNTQGANFFLINPNGITFGTNARLNVGQTFVGSTANGIDLVDGGGGAYRFGTSGNDAPLLTINPNALLAPAQLIMGGRNGQINNFGTLQTNNPNQYIGLIGGNVSMNGGQIIAPGGKVEIGGLNQAGEIGFSLDNGVQLTTNVERGNVLLGTAGTSPSIINVESAGGGSVGIFAKDINLQGTGTNISGGIATGVDEPTATAGNIKLDATGNITLSEGKIYNQVVTGGVGKGGNVDITTRNLTVTNGAQLTASTFGTGDAGSVKITATGDVSFDGVKDGSFSGAFSQVREKAVGKGGNVDITTRNLFVTNGALLTASTQAKGDAGTVKIMASDNISFDSKKDGFLSGAFSRVQENAEGKGGDIDITTRNLSVTNGSRLRVSTVGKGDAGSIKIKATGDISFDDGNAFSQVEQGGVGKGGNVDITTRNLTVTNGAQLTASTFGTGDAGSVKITATGDVSFDVLNVKYFDVSRQVIVR